MILIPTSIKILRPLGVLPGFMMNQTAKRCEAWNDLWVLIHQSNTPWICAGHFNELLSKVKSWAELCEVTLRSNILRK